MSGLIAFRKIAAGAADQIPVVEQHASEFGKCDRQQREMDAASPKTAPPIQVIALPTTDDRDGAGAIRIAIHGLQAIGLR